MKKIKLFFTALALSLTVLGYAQNVTVTGVVKDASTGDAVPFAAIQIKGTEKGAGADVDGNYQIVVSANATLVFSSIGYISEEVAVAGKNVIDVFLKPDAEVLEGAVAIGYGSAKKIGNVVGSVTTVKSDIVKNAPSSSPLDQLQGQVAGLAVLTTGGVAGDVSTSMNIHGIGSLGASSTPLFVIDGVPSAARAVQQLNANDILSVSVLKSATATSIYGARAANGVIYITTRGGSYSQTARVTLRTQWGLSTLADKSLYENMMSGDELVNFWLRSGIHTEQEIFDQYTSKGYTANTKWYNVFQRFNNLQSQNDVTIEGGGQKVSYLISASQYHQDGSTVGNYYNKYTVRSNIQARPKDWLKVGVNVGLSYDEQQQNPNWGSAGNVSNYTSGGLSFLNNPLYPAYKEDGSLYYPQFPNGSYNPYYYMENNRDTYNHIGLNGVAFVQIEPVRNLKIKSQIGTDTYVIFDTWKTIPSYLGAAGSGVKGRSTEFASNSTFQNTIEYALDINENHSFSALIGQEYVDNSDDYYYAQSQKQTEDRLLNLQEGEQSTYKVSESYSASRFLSFFGHADYTLFGRYHFDATVRNDASSRFGKNNRNAWFWAAGALWDVHKENWIKDAKWINELRVKFDYGTQGNAAIGDYSSYALIGSGTPYGEKSSWVIAQPSNNDLTWEKQTLLTAGFSGRFWNCFDFELEFFNRNTRSMLMDVPYPYTSGFSEMSANVGSLNNKGIDVTLGVDIVKTKDAYVRVSTTFNYTWQKVTELFQGLDRWEIANTLTAYKVGSPVMFYCPIFAGIDPADGAPTWYLPGENKDVCTMDPSRVTKKFDEEALTQNTGRKRYAPINGGVNISAGWKGLAIAASFTYVAEKWLANNDNYFYANPSNFNTMTTHKMVSDFWTPDHTDAAWPDWSKYMMQFDTHLLENASFVRLKSLQLSYSFPAKWFENTKVLKGLKITAQGRNLLTFTKYTGIDPEVNSNLTYGIPGNSKQFLGGLEIEF